jgi:hypothetical protein
VLGQQLVERLGRAERENPGHPVLGQVGALDRHRDGVGVAQPDQPDHPLARLDLELPGQRRGGLDPLEGEVREAGTMPRLVMSSV